VRHVPKGTSIVVVPSHRPQVSGCVVLQRCVRSTVQDSRFACSVGGYRDRGKETVRVGVEVAEDRCDIEAVDEEGGTTSAVGVLEQMEDL